MFLHAFMWSLSSSPETDKHINTAFVLRKGLKCRHIYSFTCLKQIWGQSQNTIFQNSFWVSAVRGTISSFIFIWKHKQRKHPRKKYQYTINVHVYQAHLLVKSKLSGGESIHWCGTSESFTLPTDLATG